MAGFLMGLVTGIFVGATSLFLIIIFGTTISWKDYIRKSRVTPTMLAIFGVPVVGLSIWASRLGFADAAIVLFLLIAIIAIARTGGIELALIATAVCAVSLCIVILPPPGSFFVTEKNDQIVLACFLLTATFASLVSGKKRELA
jgi:K+-sensing histidine kinase KdpD